SKRRARARVWAANSWYACLRSMNPTSRPSSRPWEQKSPPERLSGGPFLFAERALALSERSIDARQHLFGHQLHRAAHRPSIQPVVADVQERAERADVLAKCEQ